MLCRDGRARRADPREPVVLVVEDEFLIAMDLELLLGQNGWRVLGPAPTVEVALELLNEEIPDVAILDINVRGKRITAVAEDLRRMGVPFMVPTAGQILRDWKSLPKLLGLRSPFLSAAFSLPWRNL